MVASPKAKCLYQSTAHAVRGQAKAKAQGKAKVLAMRKDIAMSKVKAKRATYRANDESHIDNSQDMAVVPGPAPDPADVAKGRLEGRFQEGMRAIVDAATVVLDTAMEGFLESGSAPHVLCPDRPGGFFEYQQTQSAIEVLVAVAYGLGKMF
jgi:hypothetical protein